MSHRFTIRRTILAIAASACLGLLPTGAMAADFTVMVTGASKEVSQRIADLFQARSGHRITLVADTAGGVRRRVEAGEAADVIVATPVVIDALVAAAKVVP